MCVLCIVIWVKNGRELILMWATDRKFHLQKNRKGLNCERRGGDYILNWRKVEERGGCREKQPLRRVGLTKALKSHQVGRIPSKLQSKLMQRKMIVAWRIFNFLLISCWKNPHFLLGLSLWICKSNPGEPHQSLNFTWKCQILNMKSNCLAWKCNLINQNSKLGQHVNFSLKIFSFKWSFQIFASISICFKPIAN